MISTTAAAAVLEDIDNDLEIIELNNFILKKKKKKSTSKEEQVPGLKGILKFRNEVLLSF